MNTTYASIGERKIRIAVFFENSSIIKDYLHDTLIWGYFLEIKREYRNKLYVEAVTSNQVKENILVDKRFDLVIVPGGDAEDHSSYLGKKGREKLREFVEVYGRGYVGICAGCYLGLAPNSDPMVPELIKRKVLDYPTEYWHYSFVPDVTSKDISHWNRGSGQVSVSLTRLGMKLMNTKKLGTKIYYANGPIMKCLNNRDNSKTEVLATFTSELCRVEGSKGQMINTPAIVANELGRGKGRVVLSSGHIEKYPEEEDAKFLMNLIIWVSKQDLELL